MQKQKDHPHTQEEPKVVQGLTAKEIKALLRPTFEANPEKYYPTLIFQKLGFSRTQCKCGHYYWRKTQKRDTCGDSKCVGKYTFIGKGCGIGAQGQKLTYPEAWKTFERSLTSSRIPCKSISRYPVVARWRNDVDYVAAGIFCFQPYCVTGELEPPENPLICPQFCVRFNDLDNIGLTGRHYSGFIMLGIQVFNYPDKYVFFKEECIEFNYRWLTEELKIDPEEITFIEDIWAGGGNLGPCVEYFVHGLELGNMVFMQYKYFPDGKYEQLSIKIIDTGIGLERVPWLVNGTPTSYYDVFKSSLEFLRTRLGVQMHNQMWEKLGPYASQLNVDQVDDIDKTWEQISKKIDVPVDKVKQAIAPVKDLYVILDHTRTVFMIVQDGGLPSNVGGGANCRNVLRRVFAILKKHNWWDKLGKVQGLLELFQEHKKEMGEMYGKFEQYKSFNDIIVAQYERWLDTDESQQKKLKALFTKNSNKLSIDDWILAMQSWGIPADAISQITKLEIPGNLYSEIAARQQRICKAEQVILYDTTSFAPTQNLYFANHRQLEFQGKIIGVIPNVKEDKKLNIVLLDKSSYYPLSGGQQNDIGTLQIEGTTYNVLDCQKIGKCVLHFLDKPVVEGVVGKTAKGKIDAERRNTLRTFHTGTHVVFAACRRVLGPHIWQNGAKKTVEKAHLDVTHFSSITKSQEMQIENEANKIILQAHPINKYFMNKKDAEKQYGFRLYQGGIVPGDNLRVVNIQNVDVEACCGTHCDNTSEVGWIKLIRTTRISDGILRLEYVAGKSVIPLLNEETKVINQLKTLWGTSQNQIVPTAKRIFTDYRKFQNESIKQKGQLLKLTVRSLIDSKNDRVLVDTNEKQATLYFSELPFYAEEMSKHGKSIAIWGDGFIFGLITKPDHFSLENFKKLLVEVGNTPQIVGSKLVLREKLTLGKGKDKKVIEGTLLFCFVGSVKDKDKKLSKFFNESSFVSM